MKHLLLYLLLITAGGITHVQAQIAIAVAKDANGSSIHWSMAWNLSYGTESKAKQKLKDQGHKDVHALRGGTKCGHDLKSGFWVVVEARRKRYDGKIIVSYGMGASANSYKEAESRAVANLRQHDWNWDKTDGYRPLEKGTF